MGAQHALFQRPAAGDHVHRRRYTTVHDVCTSWIHWRGPMAPMSRLGPDGGVDAGTMELLGGHQQDRPYRHAPTLQVLSKGVAVLWQDPRDIRGLRHGRKRKCGYLTS